jgi:hypothetical protein
MGRQRLPPNRARRSRTFPIGRKPKRHEVTQERSAGVSDRLPWAISLKVVREKFARCALFRRTTKQNAD